MKILTVLGTRPEIIRLSRVIERLDWACHHVLVHTGQNYDPSLRDLFLDELGVRRPDHYLGVRGDGFGETVGQIIAATEHVLRAKRPDRVLVLGDTDSGLAAFVARRLGIPVYRMEAGNPCFDDRVPEEANRRVIDHMSDVLLPCTERSWANLLAEGIPSRRIYVTGNPIYEVLEHHGAAIDRSNALQRLGVKSGGYFLVTLHRQENVDLPDRLRLLAESLERVATDFARPVLWTMHPRTRDRLTRSGLTLDEARITVVPPAGLPDFVRLERDAYCILSDSGTVPEECCILGVPTVTLRDVTERPETVECGSNILSGAETASVLRCVRIALDRRGTWVPLSEYLRENVGGTVANIMLGYRP
ncbi:MAG: UDP-N-acetylglucosamine 2-epimerase (non-hydrolyzing) [Chloroflexota bacterium]